MAAPRRDLRPESLSEANNRVWDFALNLLHPAFFYVFLQLLILDHLSESAPLAGRGPLEPTSLAIYGMQFLGAWTVLYTTLLRDMGFHSSWGTVLLLAALAGAVAQYFIIPEPRGADDRAWALIGVQVGLAAIAWPLTVIRWRRLKTQWLDESRAAQESDQ